MHPRPLVLAALLACLLLPAPTDAQPAPGPHVRVTELLPVPDATLGQREFVELLNAGTTDVDLAGWRLQDAPTASNNTNRFTFAALVLAPGDRVVVWSNGSADAVGPSWSTSPSKTVWNDAGDAVTLLAPDGTVHDWFGYGSTTQPAPAGFNASKPAPPTRGQSLQLDAGAWTVDEPTPGLAPGQQGGHAVANVANVAPRVNITAPTGGKAGDPVLVHLAIGDDNGASDILAWTLHGDGKPLRNGTGAHNGTLTLPAPATGGAWTLVASARDAGGAVTNATATVQLRLPRVAVQMPNGGALRFPALRPGDRDVASLDAFTLRNDGEDPTRPLLDVSAFRGPGARIAVDGNLWVGVGIGAAVTWLRYDGALQALPELEPGAAMTVTLRIGAVPTPSPAGAYGTTFTVVAT